jgi:hypothetical protein
MPVDPKEQELLDAEAIMKCWDHADSPYEVQICEKMEQDFNRRYPHHSLYYSPEDKQKMWEEQ